MAYEPINRKGIYGFETVTLPDGSRWTWKPIRDRWETTGDIDYQTWLSKGGTSYVYNVNTDFNPIQQNESVRTGTGEIILNTNNTDNTQAQIDAKIQSGAASTETLQYIEQHLDITVKINKSSTRGKVYVSGREDDFTMRKFNSSRLETGGFQIEIREGDSKKSRDRYKIYAERTTKTINGIAGSIKTPSWVVIKETFKDDKFISKDFFEKDGDIISLDYDLSSWDVDTTPTEDAPKYTLNIFLDSSNISNLLKYSFDSIGGNLPDGILTSAGPGTFNIKPQSDQIGRDWNFIYILKKSGKIINESTSPIQTYQLKSGEKYTLQVAASKGQIDNTPVDPVNKPSISTSTNVLSFNLASKETSISYSTRDANKVIYTLGNTTRTLSANGVLKLSSSDFSKVGQFELYLQPVGNGGSGDAKKIIVNVSNTTSIAGPDITHISYPENIIGEDFKGYDIDFKISWASVNTDWVDIWVGKVSNDTKLYTKRDPQGQLTLNIRDVLTKAGDNLSEDVDVVDFKLLLSPFNDRGDSTFQGKVEEVIIRFDKGNLKLRRGDVVRDIREVISKQFDTSILKKEDSKYLTHLLHLGEGDNKIISTWGVDTETFSEYKVVDSATGREAKVKEVKTLVLKLYEPLPKSIQPNQQVWMSKVQSIPLLESITVIDESVEECIPLQPNFNEKFSDDIGLQIYDDLIASGSTTSTDLVNQFVSGSGFDLKKLDIQFVSSSEYAWDNFVKYSSAEERVENFIYKVKLIEFYDDKLLIASESLDSTNGSITVLNEKNKLESQRNSIFVGFDAFEDYLYTNEISSSTQSYSTLLLSAQRYDTYNPHRLVSNLPSHVQNDEEGSEFVLFFDMLGQHFDILWLYTNSLAKSKKLEHKYQDGISNEFIYQMLESLGWDADMGAQSQALWQYAYGNWNAEGDTRNIDGTSKSVESGKDNQNEIWRRILNNLPYLLKHKGTKRALHALMSCYGIPASLLTVMEFGGPRDTTKSGTTPFTYEDRTASINISGSSKIQIDWKEFEGDFPNSVEVRVNSDIRQDQQIMYGSDWSVDVIQDTGSLAKFQLTVGGVSSSTEPMPFFNDEYTQIVVNRETGSLGNNDFTLYAKEGFQERIRNEVFITLSAPSASWESGSSVFVGGTTFTGSVDEIRLWNVALDELVIENHTLLPDAINGNHSSASSEDLIFRNDFEYPKDRGTNVEIKNVSIKQTYATSSIAVDFDSIVTYPYNYTPYERTVTAQVPSSGFNFNNKVRFETQYNLDGSEITDDEGIGLSYRERSTQKSYDQSPIDSDRLGLFFSPIKEINMDILRSVGPLNIDDYIGDPSDDYNYSYSNLDTFREYYFERYNLNFNEYVQLVRYIDKTLFDQLESLVPARAKVAKGLLIEPHILERSKTQWKRPEGEENYHETSVDTTETTIVSTEQNTFLSLISASEDIHVSTEQSFYDGSIHAGEITEVSSSIDNFEGTYVTTNESSQSGVITRNSGSTMGGFEIDIDAQVTGSISSQYQAFNSEFIGGFGPNDLAVAGFGLYGSGSYSIRTRLDGNGNIVKDRIKVFKVKEAYEDTERVQVSGYPTGSGPVTYEVRNITRYNDFVTILPWDGADLSVGGKIVEVTPLDGHFSTHYRNVEDLTTGLENSYFNGSKQTQQTTLDGGPAWEIFTTNPNTLKVSDSGRGSGEPILEVD